MLLLLLACAPAQIKNPGSPSGGDTDPPIVDTADTADTADTSGDDTAPPAPVEGFSLVIDEDMATLVRAAWDDPGAAESWVEYRFEGEEWLIAPATGPGSAAILGVPAETEVEARAVAVVAGSPRYSETLTATTGSLPGRLPIPQVSEYKEGLAYEAEYAMIVVAGGPFTYQSPYWIEIFDRAGRIVWYKEVPGEMMSLSPSVSRDGTHIWHEASDIFGMGQDDPYVTRQTLDGRWSLAQEIPGLGQAISEGPDGSFFFEYRRGGGHALQRLAPDGEITTEWDCSALFGELGIQLEYCDMNACNWSEERNTVLVSQFYTSTVFEIDLGTGEPIRQMGQLTKGDPYAFDPPSSEFDYQHYPYWTEDGTILTSTHIDGVSGVQVAAEYTVDDATKTLTRVWSYVSKDMWATQVGEAVRLPNDNVLQNYGQDGALREVTPEGEVVWQVEWEKDSQGYRVVGHSTLIPDLYALNRGW